MRVSVSNGKEYISSFLLAKSPEMFQEAVSEIKLYYGRNHRFVATICVICFIDVDFRHIMMKRL